MEAEAIIKGFYKSPAGINYPKIQILTIEDILGGKMPNLSSIVPSIQVSPTKRTGNQSRLI